MGTFSGLPEVPARSAPAGNGPGASSFPWAETLNLQSCFLALGLLPTPFFFFFLLEPHHAPSMFFQALRS